MEYQIPFKTWGLARGLNKWLKNPNTLYAQRARRAPRAVQRTSRFQAGADAGAGGLTGVPLCAPGLLPLLRAGARLRSRSRRIAEVVVVVVDRAVVDRGVVSSKVWVGAHARAVRWRSCGHAGRGYCRSCARVLACARARAASSKSSSSLSTAAAASTNCAACRRRNTSLSGGPSAETCGRRSAVAPCCPAATRSSHRVASGRA